MEVDGWSGCNGPHYIAVVVTSRAAHSLLLDLLDTKHEAQTVAKIAAARDYTVRASAVRSVRFNAIMGDEAANYRLARIELVENSERVFFERVHLSDRHQTSYVVSRGQVDLWWSGSTEMPVVELSEVVRDAWKCNLDTHSDRYRPASPRCGAHLWSVCNA